MDDLIMTKSGEVYNINDMKKYLLEYNSKDSFTKFKLNHGMTSIYSYEFLLDKVEKIFGDDGIRLLFLDDFDFTDEAFDRESSLIFNRLSKNVKPLSKIKYFVLDTFERIKEFFSFGYKYMFIDIWKTIIKPITFYLHVNEYKTAPNVSYWFDIDFLVVCERNLKYYQSIVGERYVIEGWLNQNMKDVQDMREYCMAYGLLNAAIGNYNDYFICSENYKVSLYGNITEESKKKMIKSYENCRVKIKELNNKLIELILECGI